MAKGKPAAPATPEAYLASLAPERQGPMGAIRDVLLKKLPKGYAETVAYGMLTYVVPHSLYPAGYHCDPKQPLPFISLGSRKDYIALHHMGLYGSPELLAWFTAEWPKHSPTKLDMGKGCVRLKEKGPLPLKLVGELAGKLKPKDWIALYKAKFRR